MISRPLCVVQTWYAVEPYSGGVYIVELAEPDRPRAPRLELVTYDRGVYQAASYAEGWPVRVIATYHAAGLRLVLDALTPAPATLD